MKNIQHDTESLDNSTSLNFLVDQYYIPISRKRPVTQSQSLTLNIHVNYILRTPYLRILNYIYIFIFLKISLVLFL